MATDPERRPGSDNGHKPIPSEFSPEPEPDEQVKREMWACLVDFARKIEQLRKRRRWMEGDR